MLPRGRCIFHSSQALGVICQIDAIAIEFHDERRMGFLPVWKAAGAPANFAAVLEYIAAHGRPECKVEVIEMSAVGS